MKMLTCLSILLHFRECTSTNCKSIFTFAMATKLNKKKKKKKINIANKLFKQDLGAWCHRAQLVTCLL